MNVKRIGLLAVITIFTFSMIACDGNGANGQNGNVISLDGSNTVYPVAGAISEEFSAATSINTTVGVSGTGGGFQRFCRGEIDITGASRPIRDSELQACAEGGVDYLELPIAYDGITVAVHPDNDWVDEMTVDELKKLWEPAAQGKITHWNQIRDEWPERRIELFGNSTDNGTYDYFTHAIVGEQHSSRGDYTGNVNGNILIQGISNNTNALGFFPFAYYFENQDRVRSIGIALDEDSPAVVPSQDSINDGSYQPLARPMFFYVSTEAAEREEVQQFIEFIAAEGPELIREVGYVDLPQSSYEMVLARFDQRITGTAFTVDGAQVGITVEELLKHAQTDPS